MKDTKPLLLLGLAWWLWAGPLLAAELHTLAGKNVSGTVTGLTDSEITMRTDAGQTVATPLSQVLALDLRPVKGVGPGKYSDVRLLDDTVLHCGKVVFKGQQVELTLLSGLVITLPVNQILSVVHEAQNETLMKKWTEVLSQKSRRDRIVILREGDLNALEGTLGEVDAQNQTIQFKREGADAITVRFERLHGLAFFRLESPVTNPLCRVYDLGGNMLTAVKLGFDGKDFLVTTSFGAKVPMPAESLARLDFNLGKITFLSDLEPAKVLERPGLGLPTPFRRDANLNGEPIVLDKNYPKGLSLHAYTELEYNLGGKYKEFKAILGVDGRVSETESKAVVTIYCDGEKRFSEVVNPKAVRLIALNIKDVQVLRIVVGARDFTNLHDHATLAEARVSQ